MSKLPLRLMNSVLSAKRLTLLFGALLVFQVIVVAATLSLSTKSLIVAKSSIATPFFLGRSGDVSVSQGADLSLDDSDELAILPDETSAITSGPQGTSLETSIESSVEALNPARQALLVRSGDTLAQLFSQLGGSHLSALRAHEAMRKSLGSASALRIGESLEIELSATSEVVFLRRALPDGRVMTLTGAAESGYTVDILEVLVEEQPKTLSGVISSSLSSAAKEVGLSAIVVDEFVDLFSNRIEFRRDLQSGDTFSVTFLERTNQRTGELLRPGSITSASLNTGGKLLVAVRHTNEKGEIHYFDEQGNPLGNYFLRYPLKFSRISSTFSYARFHPVLKRTRPHNGVDFAAPIGTPVRAVGDGIVRIASYNGGAGNMVKISHGDRWSTAYLHLHTISRDVRPGMRVTRGQVIGSVGTTGLSTGPHLHFSLYDRERYVDPMKTSLPAMNEKVAPLSREYLLAALEAVRVEHQRVASTMSHSHTG